MRAPKLSGASATRYHFCELRHTPVIISIFQCIGNLAFLMRYITKFHVRFKKAIPCKSIFRSNNTGSSLLVYHSFHSKFCIKIPYTFLICTNNECNFMRCFYDTGVFNTRRSFGQPTTCIVNLK